MSARIEFYTKISILHLQNMIYIVLWKWKDACLHDK